MIQGLKRRSAKAVEQYHAILDEEEAQQAASSPMQAAPSAHAVPFGPFSRSRRASPARQACGAVPRGQARRSFDDTT